MVKEKRFTVTRRTPVGGGRTEFLGAKRKAFATEAEARESIKRDRKVDKSRQRARLRAQRKAEAEAAQKAKIEFETLKKEEAERKSAERKKREAEKLKEKEESRKVKTQTLREAEALRKKRVVIDKTVGQRIRKEKIKRPFRKTKEIAGEFAQEAPRVFKKPIVETGKFALRRSKQFQDNIKILDEVVKEVVKNPKPAAKKIESKVNTAKAFIKNLPRGVKGIKVRNPLPLAAAYLDNANNQFRENPGKALGSVYGNVVFDLATGKLIGDAFKVSVAAKQTKRQLETVDDVIDTYKKAGVTVRDRTPLGTELRKAVDTKKSIRKTVNTIDNKIDNIAKTKVTPSYTKNINKKVKSVKKDIVNVNKKAKAVPKKTQAQLKAELAQFEAERLAKTTKAPKLRKADETKRFIAANKNNPAKLESLLEDAFGKKEFKKLRKQVEKATGKKVLVRQTKLKQVRVKGGKLRAKTRTKVNIVDRKSPKIQLKKGESIKRIDAGDNIFIENLDEVKKASKEIDFQFNQGRIDDINKAVTKWDKKGSLQLVNKNKRKNFVRKVKNKAKREVDDVKQIYRLSRDRFKKASKKIRELSAKRRARGLTANQAKQFTKAKGDLRKAITGLAKSEAEVRKLRKSLRILPKLARRLAVGLAAKEISALGIDNAIDQANDQIKALEPAVAQDLKKAQVQEQALDEPKKPQPKPKGTPRKKTRGTTTKVVRKLPEPVKKVTPKLKAKRLAKKKVPEKIPKKIPLPTLDFDGSALRNKQALFIVKYRERQNPRKPFNKRTNKVVVKTKRLQTTKNRALKFVGELADKKAIRSIDIKLAAITAKKIKDIKSPKVLTKFRKTKSKLKDRLNLVEKSKFTLDKKSERRELASLKKKKPAKKKTTKKKVVKKVKRKKR